MKLYLGSYLPWETGEDITPLVEMIGENKTMKIIMNGVDFSDDTARRAQSVAEAAKLFGQFGISVDELDLRDYFGKQNELEKALSGVGAIYAYGGNTYILRRAFRQSGLDEFLPKLLRRGVVYGGISVGSCVCAPTLRGLDGTDDPNIVPEKYEPEIIWDGLGLVPYSILPHYRSDHPESASVEEDIKYFKKHNLPYKTLRDGEAIVVNDEEAE